MNSEYKAYLSSKEWKEKRKEFLESANYECEDCGGKATQVHHLNYDCLGKEKESDVVVLCKQCHEDREIEKGTELDYDGEEYGEWY